jgi:hypothetical protein
MQISLDASTSNQKSTSGTSHSFSHTVGTAKAYNTLFAAIALRGQSSTTPSSISATYNSASMEKIGEHTYAGGIYIAIAIFRLRKPSTGSNTLAFTWTNDAIGAAYAVSLYGVSQSSPERSGSYTTMSATNSTTPSIAVPSNSGDWVLDVIASESVFGGTISMTVGSGQTVIMNSEVQLSNRIAYGGSYEAGASPTVTMGWSKTSGGYWAIMAGVSVQPHAGGSQPVVSPSMVF